LWTKKKKLKNGFWGFSRGQKKRKIEQEITLTNEKKSKGGYTLPHSSTLLEKEGYPVQPNGSEPAMRKRDPSPTLAGQKTLSFLAREGKGREYKRSIC